jgi:hypothetical protein
MRGAADRAGRSRVHSLALIRPAGPPRCSLWDGHRVLTILTRQAGHVLGGARQIEPAGNAVAAVTGGVLNVVAAGRRGEEQEQEQSG